MPDLPQDAPGFLAAYARAAGLPDTPLAAPRTGTIGAGVAAFLASDEYLSKASTTRGQWRRQIDRIRIAYGAAPLRDLEARHIQKDLAGLKPHPANARLKVWRALCGWWCAVGLKAENPGEGVKRRKVPRSQGHKFWTEEDVAAFRARWPLASAERLAFELLHWTGARMSDAVRLTEGMIGRDGWLTYAQGKTGHEVHIPLRCPAPAYADPAGQAQLLAAMDARPARHALLMVTQHGKGRSIKAASAWFAAAARAAGVRGKSAHGLRKRRGNILAENGANTKQMAAWLGHESLAMVQHYSKGADLRKTIMGTGVEQKSSNYPAEVPRMAEK
ncbi:MAG: tyrosine-type recombinase/integrase [Gemmobacter sp.]